MRRSDGQHRITTKPPWVWRKTAQYVSRILKIYTEKTMTKNNLQPTQFNSPNLPHEIQISDLIDTYGLVAIGEALNMKLRNLSHTYPESSREFGWIEMARDSAIGLLNDCRRIETELTIPIKLSDRLEKLCSKKS
jgi:hypothetical protein